MAPFNVLSLMLPCLLLFLLPEFLTKPITGIPPSGCHTLSGLTQTFLIADSSLET